MKMKLLLIALSALLNLDTLSARIHLLSVYQDKRQTIDILSFGFQSDGYMSIQVQNFTRHTPDLPANKPTPVCQKVGFSLSRGEQLHERMKAEPDVCALNVLERNLPEAQKRIDISAMSIVFFDIDVVKGKLIINRTSDDLDQIFVCAESTLAACQQAASSAEAESDRKQQKVAEGASTEQQATIASVNDSLPLSTLKPAETTAKAISKRDVKLKSSSAEVRSNGMPVQQRRVRTELPLLSYGGSTSFHFTIIFRRDSEEGYYYLTYHNCYNNYVEYAYAQEVSYDIHIEAKNGESYLSAGEIPYPIMYFFVASLFFATFIVWALVLKATRENVYKIHYLMAMLIFLKSMSLLFHGVNFYFISEYGHQKEIWAVVFYIMHLLKGALLFGVVILIGTGWTFFKHFLTDRDKRILMVVIPLQVLDNIALIIVEESEEGQAHFKFWWQVLIFVDLLCCAAIILPIIWSIRHLQEASQTDGKAAFNLGKLKLFHQFYILVICYIYLTRIVKYLIMFTVPFKYTWVDAIILEGGTWFFFVVTGYKFKPAPNNPYLQLSTEDDLQMDEVITENGLLENVVRIKRPMVPKRRQEKADLNSDQTEQQELVD